MQRVCLGNLGETLAEDYASTSSMLEYIKSIPHVDQASPLKREAPKLRMWWKPRPQAG
ncbi:MAG: hypothetical protein QW778_00665 [Candidatus Micrarchaeaceae archaeon]